MWLPTSGLMGTSDVTLHSILACCKVIIGNNQATQHNRINNVNIEEELIKYKEMLDKGLITEEDYNKKKKELLGL